MDLACTFQQPKVVYSREGMDHRTLDSFNPRLRFESRGFGGPVFNCRRFVSKTRPNRQMKKFVVSGASVNPSTLARRDPDICLWGYSWRKSLICNFENVFNMSKGAVLLGCQGNDSIAYIDGSDRCVDFVGCPDENLRVGASIVVESNGKGQGGEGEEQEAEVPSLDELRELLQKAMKELEVACLNSTMFEEKAQKISETAIALKDEAENAQNDVTSTLDVIQEIVNEESIAKEAVQKATMALSLAEARVQVAIESSQAAEERDVAQGGSKETDFESESEGEAAALLREEEEALFLAQNDIGECRANLESCETELRHLQRKKEELQLELVRLNGVAEKLQMDALKAEEDVANIMHLAEQAVAFELEATQRVNDVEIALQKVEKSLSSSHADAPDTTPGHMSTDEAFVEEVKVDRGSIDVLSVEVRDVPVEGASLVSEALPERQSDTTGQSFGELIVSDELKDKENGKLGVDSSKEAEVEVEKSKNVVQTKKQETQKDLTRDSSPFNAPKALSKKSSRFFSASFFSFTVDGTEFTPMSVFHGLIGSARKQLPNLIVGLLLVGSGITVYANRADKSTQLLPQPDVVTTMEEFSSSAMEEFSSSAKPLVRQIQKLPQRIKKLVERLPDQELNEEEASLFDMLWLLLASVIFVPVFQKIPGGSPVLGYLAAGILIGPYGFSIIRHVHGTKAIAEFGVVFLLFNIGLELSVERLSSMKKYVFGLGSAQVLVTAVVVGLVAHFVSGQPGPAAIVIGNGLALSSTAVVLQVLQERGESTSRHGRATFSVLLFQDLAVVVLLILIPLISPNSSKGGIGFQAIAEALGLAAVKAVAAIVVIIAGGRLLLRPIYRQIAENQNAEIFSANTLLVILGTSVLTARAGLSMALGAFLAGLLLAETEFSLQVESDIAPYRGLLLGLFFMTVGMSIDPKLLVSNFPVIMGTLGLLIGGKAILVALVGKLFGISIISAIRVGLLLAPGGEFAFVAFGEAVNQGIMSPQLSSLLFLVVGISMALTPWLAAGGQLIASRFELHDVRSLLPVESETDDLQDHIILCGFGRVGQIIAQLLSERLIPFVALDVRSDRVAIGRALDLPVYFGDAGSREVLHKVGAERACAAAITLDTPGANYRTVWALSKYFPNVKTFVRAHDVDHGLNLEKAGATAVVPETLEPSLQLAAAVLAQAKLPMSEIAATINEYRTRHLSELTEAV
ncbi:K(+) efflux antiporter 2, chloroplastic-like isoform X2 [Malania oleifera]|uniref:K(+) efflux antiporter 2, chloroplastic-like isoform X2 n=1 Tax=Malania oleifera TaxID=397392 RepID=UPI0025AE89D7|nr:K(+) efflux antiporter 2, chloroplastic-like isoform X2 [Malania oleifera]XP_057980074.1 K(+) efflux antiporter 2, chloroplastic-like isoform X2 [Malania oleifera]XP_057980075.1 K(+) efflux antiporter 2, chloroplastic-like isoform X2 [Malania oleifera]